MKRRFLLLVLASLAILTAAACGTPQTADCYVPSAADLPDNTLGITLTAKDVTPEGMTLVCTQSGGDEVRDMLTGTWYTLELYTVDGWKQLDYAVDTAIAWEDIGWVINMEGVTEWQVSWKWLYGSLDAGTYRISKEILYALPAQGGYSKQICCAVFTVE